VQPAPRERSREIRIVPDGQTQPVAGSFPCRRTIVRLAPLYPFDAELTRGEDASFDTPPHGRCFANWVSAIRSCTDFQRPACWSRIAVRLRPRWRQSRRRPQARRPDCSPLAAMSLLAKRSHDRNAASLMELNGRDDSKQRRSAERPRVERHRIDAAIQPQDPAEGSEFPPWHAGYCGTSAARSSRNYPRCPRRCAA
jgi:hypothetical protein